LRKAEVYDLFQKRKVCWLEFQSSDSQNRFYVAHAFPAQKLRSSVDHSKTMRPARNIYFYPGLLRFHKMPLERIIQIFQHFFCISQPDANFLLFQHCYQQLLFHFEYKFQSKNIRTVSIFYRKLRRLTRTNLRENAEEFGKSRYFTN